MASGRVGRVGIAILAALSLASPVGAERASGASLVPAASEPPPRVVIIVGPVGRLTAKYRAIAERAAVEASRWTSDVIRVYSPEATWPAVRTALQGASVIVYLGHGNGWPSPHRDALFPRTQNGFGLNPVAGVDDRAHQYFGEAYLAREVRLASGAIVLLHHLCYASGNSEPGLPEGPLETAVQRVDNFAAGFFAAGARAVMADAFAEPADYLRELLGRRRPIRRIWETAATDHGRRLSFPSVRTPGASLTLDPSRPRSGFYRSIAERSAAGAPGAEPDAAAPVVQLPPTLIGSGISFGAPRLSAVPVSGRRLRIILPTSFAVALALPPGLQLGYRWDPLEVNGVLGGAAGLDTAEQLSEPARALAELGRVGPADPGLFVAAEQPGSLVEPAPLFATRGGVAIRLSNPTEPGLYRIVLTLHGSDGVAFDPPTQALLAPLLVRVYPRLSALYRLPAQVTVRAGGYFAIEVELTNTGTIAWGDPTSVRSKTDEGAAGGQSGQGSSGGEPESRRARLVARWIDVVGETGLRAQAAAVPVALGPGERTRLIVPFAAPDTPGTYLVVLDLVLPDGSSLASSGVPLGLVTVIVRPPVPPLEMAS